MDPTTTTDVLSDLTTNLGAVDYTIIASATVSLIPAVFPAVFSLMAIRKGIGFVLSLIRGA